jgi:inner membrane protein
MPTPVGHALAGALIYSLSNAEEASSTKRLTAVLACSLLPDVDFLFGWFSGSPNRFHHQFTHSLFFVIVAGVLIALALAGRNRVQFRLFSVLFIGAGVSHIILDLLAVDTTAPFGVPLFWPFSHEFFISPVRIFFDVRRAMDSRQFFSSMLSWHNLKTMMLEIVFLAPWLIWRYRRRKNAIKIAYPEQKS